MTYFWLALAALVVAFFAVIIIRALRFTPKATAKVEPTEVAVDEAAIVAACDAYVFIGNTQVHQHKPILALPHRRLTPSWLQSRAINGTPDFIGIWERAT